MKLAIETRILGEKEAEAIAEFISTNEALEITIANGLIQFEDSIYSITQAEIFQIGEKYGKENERAKWTAPESFDLSTKYANILREAVKEYSRQTHIEFNSIAFKERSNNPEMTEIIFTPTLALHLFNLALQYQKLCYRKSIIADALKIALEHRQQTHHGDDKVLEVLNKAIKEITQ